MKRQNKMMKSFYPANPSQAASSGEKCMDLRFLRLRRWLLKQQPDKTVFNRFIKGNTAQLRLRVTANLLHQLGSFQTGKYIQ